MSKPQSELKSDCMKTIQEKQHAEINQFTEHRKMQLSDTTSGCPLILKMPHDHKNMYKTVTPGTDHHHAK